MLGDLGVTFLNALFTDDGFFARYSIGIETDRMNAWRAIVLDTEAPAVHRIRSEDVDADVDAAERTLLRIGKVLVFDSAIRHGATSVAGMRDYVIPLCDDLIRMNSYRPVRLLVVGAIDFLRTTRDFEYDIGQAAATMRLLQERLRDIEFSHLDRLGQLTSSLNEFRDHNLARACVAATYWTIGDLPRAWSIGHGSYWPSFRQIRGLFHDAIQRLDRDLLILGVLNRFQGHYGSIDGFERVLTTPPLGISEELINILLHYGEIAIMYFAGSVPSDDSRELQRLFEAQSSMIWAKSPSAWLRIAALLRLVDPLDGQLPSWDHLFAASAAELIRTSGPLAAVDEYDVSTSLAGHFIDDGGGAALNRMEGCRSTSLGYWLYLSPHSPAGTDRSLALHNAFRLNRVVQPGKTHHGTQTDFGPPGGPTRVNYSNERARFTSAEFIGELNSELMTLASHYRDVPSPMTPTLLDSFSSVLAVRAAPSSRSGE